MAKFHFVIGGARSGKSKFAEQLASQYRQVCYIATATRFDSEMDSRIQHHQARRPENWLLLEAPVNLVGAIKQAEQQADVILLDCLTLWINNIMFEQQQPNWPMEFAQLAATIQSLKVDIIVVANEVGLGVVPATAICREFVDEAGRLNQTLAQIAHKVTFMAAGLPMFNYANPALNSQSD
ncbi:adenosylcobinamide kinase/adenosylcobinamide-phosphate guanylyltransferase [Catenovulum agarivorans DS-2]|uniref:Bifunctional adenosylcobalamin biosynthesis protein n=1 Tax=Catenovulum agarivorans DS-2 TaxID=1328313 RepID=W7QHH5_9ALTE|nr:bifunctional adenosylcobinamide kinase/adenosylcobinamide-phosphate guanylyltransferase [Catenovulum agarivorans]EWH11336.1 adenosylcobinamide kinase/adenosylcobinamide-phosphate guanylyltransferase [Catenovulum agarivorans DS-2]